MTSSSNEQKPKLTDTRIVEAQVARIRDSLASWSAHMAAKYGGPVYLVGSVLRSPTPRDIDIRVVVPDYEFAARYGHEVRELPRPVVRGDVETTHGVCWATACPSQRWVDDTAKIGGAISQQIKHNVDFKVWPSSHWRELHPAPLVLAAPSPSAWVDTCYTPVPDPEASNDA